MKKTLSKTLFADQDVEQLIGTLLRYGVIISSVIVTAGGAYYLARHGQQAVPPYHAFKGEKIGFTTFSGILEGFLGFQPRAIIQLGVLVLIATPILRIAFSLVGFVLEKDKLYIVITSIVLCIMLVSMFGGLKV
jgi:uncharacterized membrane protein